MGQYFKYINRDKQEYFIGEGGAKPVERATDPIGTGMLAYLMFDGPQDGTRFSGLHNPYAPEFEGAMAEKMEEERERHRNAGRSSVYRNDDSSWDKPKLARVIAAGRHINDDELGFRFAGRWAGDDVALVGDYEESGVYQETRDKWHVEYEGDRYTVDATGAAPIVPESLDRDDIEHTVERREVEPGDLCEVYVDEMDERVYAEYIGEADTEWTNITEGLKRSFTHFVGQQWVDDHEDSWIMRPDMILQSDEDGDIQVFTGSQTAAMTEAMRSDDPGGTSIDTSAASDSDTPAELRTDGGTTGGETQTRLDRF